MEPEASSAVSRKPRLTRVLRTIFSSRAEESDLRLIIARRRRFVMAAVLGTLSINFLMFLRFFFPRALYEPKTRFKIGYPTDFGFGVDTKFEGEHRIWVVRNTEGIFVIRVVDGKGEWVNVRTGREANGLMEIFGHASHGIAN